MSDTTHSAERQVSLKVSHTPRYDANDPRNPSCVADAIADLTDQVARLVSEVRGLRRSSGFLVPPVIGGAHE